MRSAICPVILKTHRWLQNFFGKGELCLVTSKNVPRRVVHRPRSVLRGVHPSSAGDELQNFLVAFARVWHVSKGEYFPQQHSKGPAHRTGGVGVGTRHTGVHAHSHTETLMDTHTHRHRCKILTAKKQSTESFCHILFCHFHVVFSF